MFSNALIVQRQATPHPRQILPGHRQPRCDLAKTPTILTSQLPVSRWHEQIGDPTLADGMLDRLVHHAHRIEMKGDSMRKSRPKGEQRVTVNRADV
jgi:hypothetical protein